MPRNGSTDNTTIWVICAIVLVASAIVGAFSPSGSTSAPSSSSYAPEQNSFEYRYARERFRQEGYSSADADTAAKAVYKFHQAQQSRK